MKIFNKYLSLIILGSCFLFSACDDDVTNDTLGPVASGFLSNSSSTEENGSAIAITVGLEASAIEAGTVVININETNISSANYTLNPAASGGQMTLSIPAGSNSVSFSITPVDDDDVDGDKTLTLSLSSASNGVRLGNTSLEHTVTIIEDDGLVIDQLTFDLNTCEFGDPLSIPFFAVNEGGSNPFTWSCTSFGQTGNAIEYNAFRSGSAVPSDAWAIIDLNSLIATSGNNVDNSKLNKLEVECFVRSAFSGNGGLDMLYSQDYSGSGNPSAANWTSVTNFQAQLPSGGSRVWQLVTVDVSAVTGSANGYVAFRHTGGVDGSTESWNIDDITITTTGVE